MSQDKLGETHYTPHHPIIRDDKTTTKIRKVNDACARDNGPSLNDYLCKGPRLTPLLCDILLGFRSHVFALTSDIEKAFLQINFNENNRDYLRLFWFDNIYSDEPKVVRNHFARVMFGVTSLPFYLNGTIRKHVQSYNFDKIYLWTDSKVTLSWIKSIDKEFKTFVENRLQEIQNNNDIENWSYCPIEFNPADLITCVGITKQFIEKKYPISELAWPS